MCEERGFKVPHKLAPEMGASPGYQRGPQRQARAVAISADPTETGAQREKRRDSRTEARRQAALSSPRGLSAPPPGRVGLGAETRALVGSQVEDWGWRHEHSLKGLVHHSWLEGSPRKICSCRSGKRLFLASLFHGVQGKGIQSSA